MSLPSVDVLYGTPTAPASAPPPPRSKTPSVDVLYQGRPSLHPQLQPLIGARAFAGIKLHVTSTTSDQHLPDSLHYKGLAVDVVPQDPGDWDRLISELRAAGYNVIDERTKKSRHWTGPHLHVETRGPEAKAARIARVEAQFAAKPSATPGQVFTRGVVEQGKRVAAGAQRYGAAAIEHVASAQTGSRSRVIAIPPAPTQLGAQALGAAQFIGAPATAIGDVVLQDTMALMHEAGVPEPVIIAYGTVVQTALDVIVDPSWLLVLGTAVPLAAGRLAQKGPAVTRLGATQELRRSIRETLNDPSLDPATRARLQAEVAKVDRAIEQADIAIARRERVGRVDLQATKGVELEPPAAQRVGALGLEETKPTVTPVTRAPVRERIATAADRAAAEARRAEEVTQQVSRARVPERPGAVIVPGKAPRAGKLIVPGAAEAPPGTLIVPSKAAPRRPGPELGPLGLRETGRLPEPKGGLIPEKAPEISPPPAKPIAPAAPKRPGAHRAAQRPPAQAAMRRIVEEDLAARERGKEAVPTGERFVRPTGPAAAAPAPVSLKNGDVVTLRRDGELYRVESQGPRGYNLVDVQTGRKHRTVMRADVADELETPLVRTAAKPEARAAEKLELAGEEATVPAGEQAALLAAGTPTGPRAEFGKPVRGKFVGEEPRPRGEAAAAQLQARVEQERAAEKAAAKARAKKPETEMTIGEYVRGQGIAVKKNPDLVGELRALRKEGRVPPGMFRKTGQGLDDLAGQMNSLGFRDPDGAELTADSLLEALKSQYSKRLPRERFLHPAAEAHITEAEERIAAAQAGHFAEEEGLASGVIEAYLNLQAKERARVDAALKQAFELVGEVKKSKDVHRLAGEAARIYNTELLPKLLRTAAEQVPADKKLTPKFFLDILPTRVDPGTLPTMPKRKGRPGIPFQTQMGGGGPMFASQDMLELFLSPGAARRLRSMRRRLLEGKPAYGVEEVTSQARRVLKEGRARETGRQTPLEFEGYPQGAMAEAATVPSPHALDFGPTTTDIGASSLILIPRHVFHKAGPVGETIYRSMIFAYDTFTKRYEAFLIRMGDIQRGLGMRHWTPRYNQRLARRLFHAIDDPESFAAAVKHNQARALSETEQKAANEMKAMFDWYADRIDAARSELGLPPINRRKQYVTHLINDTVRFMVESSRGIPEDMAKAMRFSLPGEIFHPFLLQRNANLPVVEDIFAAMRAYVRVTEKMLAFNPVLPVVRQNIDALAPNAQNYADWWVRTTLGQPGVISNLIDTTAARMSGILGYKRVRLPGEVAKTLQLPVARKSALQEELLDDLEAVDVLVPRLYNLFRRGISRRATSAIKRLNYYSFIGLNIKVGLVNLTQPITTAAKLRAWPHQMMGDMMAGYGRVMLDVWRPSRWRYWKDKGVLSEMEKLMDEELAAGRGLLGDLTLFNMKLTEFINRVSSTVAKTRELARVERIYGEEALRLGKEFSDFVNFRYGTPFTPRLFSPQGPLGPIGHLLYSYQTFPANQMYVVATMSEKLQVKALLPDAWRAIGRGPSAFGEYLSTLAAGERGELLRYLTYGYVAMQLLAPLGIRFWDTFVKGIAPSYLEAGAEFVAGFVTADRERMKRAAWQMVPPALSRGYKGLIPLKTQADRIRRAMDRYERGVIDDWEAFMEIVSGRRR